MERNSRISTGEWTTVTRPGYVGRRVKSASARLDNEYGPGRYRIVYTWQGQVITRDEALELYTDAYEAFLAKNPDILEWLVNTAKDVYDISKDDVESGTDYSVQKQSATHLQDIAVRIALKRLGKTFQGTELIQIRGRNSKGSCLSPGQVPFHKPEDIEQPELTGWWEKGTVESFWQSNKIIQVRPFKNLLFGGSFNPIHNGHLELAKFTCDELGFDQVIFIPNGDNYSKQGLAPALTRLEMVDAAIKGEPKFISLDVEVQSTAPFRGVQTAQELRAQYPMDDLVLLRGLDALKKTHRKYFSIPGFRVLILDREGSGITFEETLSKRKHLQDNRERFEYLQGKFANPLSASMVRGAVRAGRSLDKMVPPGVAEIIEREGLYKE